MSAGTVLLSILAACIGMGLAAFTGQSLLVMLLCYSLSGASLLMVFAWQKARPCHPRGGDGHRAALPRPRPG